MCKFQKVRMLMEQRLNVTVKEIFGVLERTIAEYEEELSKTKEENKRLQKLLDAVFKPQVVLHRAASIQTASSSSTFTAERQTQHVDPESPNGFIPRLNISHVQNGVYCTIGQMMSTIIVQGGESPAPLVVDYMMTGNISQVNVTPNDGADMELREALNKVDQAATKDGLAQAVGC
ncbi:uncharacterized protein LOC133644689 isoform X2 [Entelurus aequoreus]|uniref:uncharacterized protein LOC133644689 isoform X2 n=1 Tax=Entelurus aequoreus TaxID=161455 RepID=UPI002B1D0CD8|nr:uncharacterized protein LOC133644689 isoform X2 [Entelurus aequoreus]